MAGALTPRCFARGMQQTPAPAPAPGSPALTLHIAHAVLADHPGVILLVCRPLVDEHGSVGGPSVQHDAVLQGKGSGSGLEAAPALPKGRYRGSVHNHSCPVGAQQLWSIIWQGQALLSPAWHCQAHTSPKMALPGV